MAKSIAPCKLIDLEDGRFSLVFDEFESTAELFEESELDGGGYAWHAVVRSLVKMKTPTLARKLKYDPEASMFVALSKDRAVLEEVAQLIRAALKSKKLLREAIQKADRSLMD